MYRASEHLYSDRRPFAMDANEGIVLEKILNIKHNYRSTGCREVHASYLATIETEPQRNYRFLDGKTM